MSRRGKHVAASCRYMGRCEFFTCGALCLARARAGPRRRRLEREGLASPVTTRRTSPECVVEDDGGFDDFGNDEGVEDDELVGERLVRTSSMTSGEDEDFVDFADEDGDGEPSVSDEDDDDDGVLDAKDCDRDNDGRGRPRRRRRRRRDSGREGLRRRQRRDRRPQGLRRRQRRRRRPLDPDNENDGVPDVRDSDDDNDSVVDARDFDFDNDGANAARDRDDDGDGVADARDSDDDNDGLLDRPDADDDNDGVPDKQEAKAKAKQSAKSRPRRYRSADVTVVTGSDPGVIALGQVEVERVEELDGGVRGVDGDVARDVEERLRVVEDDLHARVDQVVRRLLGAVRGHREHADDDVVLADRVAQLAVGLHREPADPTSGRPCRGRCRARRRC